MPLKMRYKDFEWPNNPRTYTLSAKRQTAAHLIPMQGFAVQDLGQNCTVLKGEGEFFGPDAYRCFQALLAVFSSGGPGTLIHPSWQSASAYFTELRLSEEPRADYVAYSFTFCEGGTVELLTGRWATGEAAAKRYHVMQNGENVWTIAEQYALSVSELLALNPEIAKPNAMSAGQRVRVR